MLPDMELYNVRELDPVVAKTCHLLFEKLGQKQNRNLIKKLCAKKIHVGLLNVQKYHNTTIQNTKYRIARKSLHEYSEENCIKNCILPWFFKLPREQRHPVNPILRLILS